MAGLLSHDQVMFCTGKAYMLFLTVSRPIVIHKEPTVQFVMTGVNVLAGYGDTSQEDNNIYTPISGIYPAQVVYTRISKANPIVDAQLLLPDGQIKIKVQSDARDFIRNGKTIMFEMDGNQYAQIGKETVQDYLGLQFYYFTLAPLQ